MIGKLNHLKVFDSKYIKGPNQDLFVLFLLAIVLSVFLQFPDSDYPFGVFKFFLATNNNHREQSKKTKDKQNEPLWFFHMWWLHKSEMF